MNNSNLHNNTDKSRSMERTIIEKRDSTLISSACSGDSRSFARLVSFYEKKVRAFGMGFFKNASDTDDFIQEVFIKVYTHLGSFRGESLFSTWLMRIAYNTAINSVKRRKEYVSLSDDYEIIDADIGPEDRQLRKLTALAVREALAELPERYAICLDLYFFNDMSHNEISEVLELPVNTVKSHIFRAKKILRDSLADYASI